MHLEKIKQNYDFRRIYGKGKSVVAPSFVLYYAKGRTGKVRLGITAGKKIGGAVERNRAKRVITAAFQQCLPNIKSGHDFIVVARSRILQTKSTAVASLMKNQLMSAGLWYDDETDKQSADKLD